MLYGNIFDMFPFKLLATSRNFFFYLIIKVNCFLELVNLLINVESLTIEIKWK